MRFIFMASLLAVATLTSFRKDPMALLRQARAKLIEQGSVSYQHTSYWPNAAGIIDTTVWQCNFSLAPGKYFKYDYVMRSEGHDISFINQELLEIGHEAKLVTSYTAEQGEQVKRHAVDNIVVKHSPLTLVNENWSYVKDTVIRQKKVREYSLVEMDTVWEGRKVFVTWHLFLNASAALPEQYERRAFLNGKSSQIIVHVFGDYKLGKKPVQLTYTMPTGYMTEISGRGEKLELLKEGQTAPAFTGVDMQGKPVSLENLRGKKVLLDFSVLNCGYCKQALDHLNQSDFKLRNDMVGVYINPTDKKQKLEAFAQRVNIPFPIVPEARDIAKQYGVWAYPTFYLISEQGIIEKVVLGYDKEFIEGLSVK